jgi:ornithine cyclodeaminase
MQIASPPVRLAEEDVRRLLDPERLLNALESAFSDRYSSISIPSRTHLQLADGIFLAMSCYDRAGHALGLKMVVVRDHPAPGEERVHTTYLLLDPQTAQPRLLIAANYLTDLRTAATSALATKFLARDDSATLGIFGTGRLARAHLRVLPLVRPFQRVLICGHDPARSQQFVQQFGTPVLSLSSANARTCAAESDVICTCTNSPTPLFDGRDLRPGVHLNLVGAFQPHTREADTYTIQHARVVVETYSGVESEAGEILIPLLEGAIPPHHIVADLHELIAGKKKGRQSPEDKTVFKSVGCALEDLSAAELLLPAA